MDQSQSQKSLANVCLFCGEGLNSPSMCTYCGFRFCDEHSDEVRRHDKNRESSSKRGYGAKWRKYRRVFLLKNPICVDPLSEHPDVVVATNVVDHIIAHKGDVKLFWDPTNHQATCGHCNTVKAVRHEGALGKKIQPIPVLQ